MIKSSILSVLLAASFLGGCENMRTGQKGCACSKLRNGEEA